MLCPYCGKELNSLGEFNSIPCHFSYSEEASDFIVGELFECENEECECFEQNFYLDDEFPDKLFFGRPEGV